VGDTVKHEHFVVTPGRAVRLAGFDPGYTGDFKDKDAAREKLARDVERLVELQDAFAAESKRALLIVLQGMDTSGKDGAIKHVMSGVNPQGVSVFSFKVPSAEELAHDFLWRYFKALPARGRVGIFNRSYYEEVLVVRVHKNLLEEEQPSAVSDHAFWQERYDDINAFERHLVRSGTAVLKFFLHVSKEEQRRRLLERLDDSAKTWKFSPKDVEERRYWQRYVSAYEHMLEHTSTKIAPWYVIPADHKWFMRTAIADVLVAAMKTLDPRYPEVGAERHEMLAAVRKELEER
jgi:PPK2 family polyphosphate:nucleotide phosphotransferase